LLAVPTRMTSSACASRGVGHPDLVALVLGPEPAGHADEIVDRQLIDPESAWSMIASAMRVNEVEHTDLVAPRRSGFAAPCAAMRDFIAAALGSRCT
jgi:hypothetical protein